jgi:large subunit ribosomal protein L35
MPKLKTHSGAKDRVRITRTGKVLVHKSFGNHLLEKKSKDRKRTYFGYKELFGKAKLNAKRKLGVS